MSMPTLHMLIGLPGSGKSTWRNNYLASNPSLDTVVVSSDDIIEEWAAANNLTYSEAWSKINQKDVAAKFRTQLKEALNLNKNIIVDRTNMGVKARREILKHVPESYETVGVVFVIPDNVLEQRLDARAKATGKVIPKFVINNMAKAYVAPIKGEFTKQIRISS